MYDSDNITPPHCELLPVAISLLERVIEDLITNTPGPGQEEVCDDGRTTMTTTSEATVTAKVTKDTIIMVPRLAGNLP
jgi:hypothetical protein